MKWKEQFTFPLNLCTSLLTGVFELVWILDLRERHKPLLTVPLLPQRELHARRCHRLDILRVGWWKQQTMLMFVTDTEAFHSEKAPITGSDDSNSNLPMAVQMSIVHGPQGLLF